MTGVRHRLLILVSTIMAAIGLLHFVALTFYFYWQLWWFDIFMHFLGGIAVGLMASWAFVAFHERGRIPLNRLSLFIVIVVGLFLVAGLWELFEYRFDLYDTLRYRADTSLDVAMGLLGAILSYVYAARLTFSQRLDLSHE